MRREKIQTYKGPRFDNRIFMEVGHIPGEMVVIELPFVGEFVSLVDQDGREYILERTK
jgi:hypothetical protein